MINFRPYAAVLLLATSASAALGDTQFAIGEPAEGAVYSGIGQISGFAVSDEKIVSVEAFIDDFSLGLVPYGGTRKDVANAFPEYPDSEFSGWAMKWNYALLEEGEHLLTIVVTEEDGDQLEKEVIFSVTGFKSEFISDPEGVDISGATIEICDAMRICVTGAMIEGEEVDVELSWNKASQQFQIDSIVYVGGEPKNNNAPEAWAGNDLTAEAGTTVALSGTGSDPDGMIESHSWEQVSGPGVAIDNPFNWDIQFSTPDAEGQIRLRLTVVDDQGASDSDDVIVTVTAPDPDPEPPPEPNQPPSADAGSDRTVDQGSNVVITGSGSDTDGTIVDWAWTQVSGPAVTLSNATQPQVSFTAPGSPGDVLLRLTVTDDDGATDSDDVIVTVRETPQPDNTTGGFHQDMLDIINSLRSQPQTCGETDYPAVTTPLAWSQSLANIAEIHSMDMARQGYFSHTSADGTSMGDRVFPYWTGTRVGENIAASSVDRSDSYVVDLWMDSPGHCALIMDPNFTAAGIGSGHNEDNGYTYHHFWTLDFGG